MGTYVAETKFTKPGNGLVVKPCTYSLDWAPNQSRLQASSESLIMFVFGNFCLSLSESRFARIKVWWTVLLSLCDDRADAGITPFLELSVNRLGGMLSKRNVESQHQLLESRAFLWRQSHHYSYSETQHGIGNFLFTGNENKGSNFALMCAGLD